MLIALACVTLLTLAALAVLAYVLRLGREERAQFAVERGQWAEERRELLERIQRPDRVPIIDREPVAIPDPEPDEIDLVGRIADDPGEGVMPTYAT